MPKSQTRSIENKLDVLTSRIILLLEKRCFTCPSKYNLQNGHLFERRHRNTRWDISREGNCHPQCSFCNSNHEPHPEVYKRKFTSKFGDLAYNVLDQRAHSSHIFTWIELEELFLGHTLKFKELTNARS